ncbi:MAG: hypothetical protein H6739_16970 [Alphaproteobacteria bacterium]|nr:hypothetical protein [Alphaproteobacteria bacterium]
MTARRILYGLSLLALAALASAGPAQAQGRPFVFEAEELVGEVQKPSIQIFVARQNLNRDYELELKESFIPRIVDSVEKKPF